MANLSAKDSVADSSCRLSDGDVVGRVLSLEAAKQNQGDIDKVGAVAKETSLVMSSVPNSLTGEHSANATESLFDQRPKKRKRKNSGRAV